MNTNRFYKSFIVIDYLLIYRYRPFYTNLARPLAINDTIHSLEHLPFMQLEHAGDGYHPCDEAYLNIQVQVGNSWKLPAPPGDSCLLDDEL